MTTPAVIQHSYSHCVLRSVIWSVVQSAVTYQLCNETLRWATVFREVERNRDRLGVVDYSVSQTTLEQVIKV